MHDAGRTNAAFVEAELMSLQFTGGAAVVRVLCAIEPIAGFARGPVIALEIGEGVFRESLPFQFCKNLTDAIVNRAQHRRHNLPIPRQVWKPVNVFLRRVHRIVRRVVRHIEEKRFAELHGLADIAHGIFGDELREVFAVSVNLLAVFPKIVRLIDAFLSESPVKDMREEIDAPRHEPKPVVKPVVFRTRTSCKP